MDTQGNSTKENHFITMYDDVCLLITTFSHISLSHIDRDMNTIVDRLSKDRLRLDRGTWIILILQDGYTTEYTHEPWI
jgi:hypothetical protein